jgi:hypothetical protein
VRRPESRSSLRSAASDLSTLGRFSTGRGLLDRLDLQECGVGRDLVDRHDVEDAHELAGAEHELVARVDVVGICRVTSFAAVLVVELVTLRVAYPVVAIRGYNVRSGRASAMFHAWRSDL